MRCPNLAATLDDPSFPGDHLCPSGRKCGRRAQPDLVAQQGRPNAALGAAPVAGRSHARANSSEFGGITCHIYDFRNRTGVSRLTVCRVS